MNRDDFIRMAREAGLGAPLSHQGGKPRVWIEGADWHDEIERFAALVESHVCQREHKWMSEVLNAFPMANETLKFIRGAIRARGNQ